MRCPVCAHDETQIVARRESDESDVIRRCLKSEKRSTTGPRTRTAASRNTVERHVRGNWVGTQCETLVQAPVPAHVIDKGIPTAGVLAQVLVAKYIDHLPLYRCHVPGDCMDVC